MPLPSFLTASEPPLLQSAPLSPPGGSPRADNKLSLSVAPQEQANWCWSAVASSVANFYQARTVWSQCALANATLGRADCCGAGASDPATCNQPWYLDAALSTAHVFASLLSYPMSFETVQSQIEKSAPVGTRVQWAGGGGHFQTITGWIVGSDGSRYLHVSDPIYSDQVIPYSEFETAYQGHGAWTHSYVTTPPSTALASAGAAAWREQSYDLESIGA